jgi:hypothetical protein
VSYIDLIIHDGGDSYGIGTQEIRAFCPIELDDENEIDVRLAINGDADRSDLRVEDKVAIENWNENWSYSPDDLEWNNEDGSIADAEDLDDGTKEVKVGFEMTAITISLEEKYNSQTKTLTKGFPLASITYKEEDGTVIPELRSWKRIIPDVETSIDLEGEYPFHKKYTIEEYQTKDNNCKNIEYEYVQYGWEDETHGCFRVGTAFEGNFDLELKPYFIKSAATSGNLYQGSILINTNNDHFTNSATEPNLDIVKLKELGYTKIRIKLQIEVRSKDRNELDDQHIWFEVNGRKVWDDDDFWIDSKSWMTRTFQPTVNISNFADGFKYRFGYVGRFEGIEWFNGCDWYINDLSVTFTAIKEGA